MPEPDAAIRQFAERRLETAEDSEIALESLYENTFTSVRRERFKWHLLEVLPDDVTTKVRGDCEYVAGVRWAYNEKV